MKKILVIGGNGQLGHCLQKIAPKYHNLYDFNFTGSAVIDITNYDQVDEAFAEYQPDFVINASAYTAVDLAEKESDRAFAVNADAVGNLAKVCKDNNAVLIHVSTDYVFDGETNLSYSEDDFTNPIGVYGASKRKGEELALDNNPETVILRTSWLYSEFNKNFVKTMLHLFDIKDELGIVGDQHGQPTNANDLAEAIMDIIEFQKKTFASEYNAKVLKYYFLLSSIVLFPSLKESTFFLIEYVYSSVSSVPRKLIVMLSFPSFASYEVIETLISPICWIPVPSSLKV